jgi:hypothetical protein
MHNHGSVRSFCISQYFTCMVGFVPSSVFMFLVVSFVSTNHLPLAFPLGKLLW